MKHTIGKMLLQKFLDLGSGIPTAGNVHEVAQAINPDAHIVYVDIDPVAVAHSQAILRHNSLAAMIQADLERHLIARLAAIGDTFEPGERYLQYVYRYHQTENY